MRRSVWVVNRVFSNAERRFLSKKSDWLTLSKLVVAIVFFELVWRELHIYAKDTSNELEGEPRSLFF